MQRTPQKRRETASATLAPTLWLVLACSAIGLATAYAADPSWWSSPGTGSLPAVMSAQVVTNNGVVTTNYVRNDYAVVTQGQLKQFTARAVDEMNASLPMGAGSALNAMAQGWAQDYATNNYASTNNPAAPYKPSDYNAVNVGQLKYIGNAVWSQLVAAGYTNEVPAWLAQNTNTDNTVAVIGQLKEVFNFDPSAVNTVTGVTATLNSDGSVTLNWSFNGATSGPVIVSGFDASGNSEILATLGADATSTTLAAAQIGGLSSFNLSNLGTGLLGQG